MGKRLRACSGFLLLFFLCICSLSAQTTQITGQWKDSNGLPYAGATMKVQLTFSGTPVSNPTVTISVLATCRANGFGSAPCQVPFTPSNGPFTLDGAGNIPAGGITLQDNSLVTPAGTQWTFTVNSAGNPPPIGTGPQVCSTATAVTGSSQNVSLGSCPALSNASSGASLSSTPTSLLPQQNTLAFAYWKLPTENPCFWIDYSGHGNNATGCGANGGTPPTIQPDIGGAVYFGTPPGMPVSYPAAVNGINTYAVVTRPFFFPPASGGTNQAILAGNGGGAAGHFELFQFTFSLAGIGSSGFSQGFTPEMICEPAGGGGTITWIGPEDPSAPAVWIFTNNGSNLPLIYYNGYLVAAQGAATCFGDQTLGNFQEGGTAAGKGYAVNTFFQGYIGPAIGWFGNFNAQDALVATQVIQEAMQVRGFDWNQCSNNQPNINGQQCGEFVIPEYVLHGDSLLQGNPSGGAYFPTNVNGTVTVVNAALSADSLCGYGASNGSMHDSRFSLARSLSNFPKGLGNAVMVWGGTDDNGATTATQLTNCYQSMAAVHKQYGVPFFPALMADRTLNDAKKNAFAAAMRQNRFSFDLMADFAIWPATGADGASGNTNVFTDGVHFTNAASFKFIPATLTAPYNHYFGNADWGTATTDTVAPVAPTAITAITEGTGGPNKVTITTAATPANCTTNTWAVVTGQTGVATYNDFYWIESTTGTTIVGTNLTSGLGAGTATGTVVCPSQVSADNYKVLNFGVNANPWLLRPCEEWAGGARSADRNIHILNINAAASTIGGFTTDHAQTINGAATLSIPAHSSVTLAVKPNATSVAGCDFITQ